MFNLISAIASVAGIVIFVLAANAGEKETILVCSLYSLNLIFQATEMTQYWFQAKFLKIRKLFMKENAVNSIS